MSRILALVKRHRLTTFFILAYVFSWWAWILYGLGLFPNPVASFGPFLAAIVVLGLTEGKAGILRLFRRMVHWRVAPGWYAVALLLPVVLAAVATALNVLLGAEPPSAAALNAWPGVFLTFAIVILIPGVGVGGARLEGLRRPSTTKRPIRAGREPHPRGPCRRLASASDGGWAGSLFRHRADCRRGDRLQLGLQ